MDNADSNTFRHGKIWKMYSAIKALEIATTHKKKIITAQYRII